MGESSGNKREANENTLPEDVIGRIFKFLEDPKDRKAVSQVCSQWHRIDCTTREHVEVTFCYSISPAALTRRFKYLKSFKIKGKPRAYEYDLLPENWGGYAEPWVNEIVQAYPGMLQLHFKRMEVTDKDLKKLASRLGDALQVLKLDKCCGFSTLGLLEIARYCRDLKVLVLEDSRISEYGGEWLHEIALHNSQLEVLNFAMTHLECINIGDLETVVEKCKNLSCLRVGDVDERDMRKVLKKSKLQEFAMQSFNLENFPNEETGRAAECDVPSSLHSLSGDILSFLNPTVTSRLKKLDLKTVLLSSAGHRAVLNSCHNLEVLEARNAIGDAGLNEVANTCRGLRRLRIERAVHDDLEVVTHNSVTSLAQNCIYLKFIALYVSDINNAALTAIGQFCSFLVDFRFILDDSQEVVPDLPLDTGVLALMRGCRNLTRLCFYLRYGGLTDNGLATIGRFGGNLEWVLLGCVGDTDHGLEQFALGCQKLEKLEMRDCNFSEAALCAAVLNMKSLKYIWVEGCTATETSTTGFEAMHRPFWNIEYYQGSHDRSKQLLAYRSLAGMRNDRPDKMVALCPT